MFELVYTDEGAFYKESRYTDFEDRGHYVVKYNQKMYFKTHSDEYEELVRKYDLFYGEAIPRIIGLNPNNKTIDILFKDRHIEKLAELTGLPLPIQKDIWEISKENHLRHNRYIYTLVRKLDGTPIVIKLYTLAEVLDWFPSHRVTFFNADKEKLGVLELYRRFDKNSKDLMVGHAFLGEYNNEYLGAEFTNNNTGILLSDGRFFDINDRLVFYPNGDIHALEQQEEYRWVHEINKSGDVCAMYKFECQWDLETSKFGDTFFNETREKIREVFDV